MRYRLIVSFVLLFAIFFLAHPLPAQTRQDALKVLQTLQSRIEAGVNLDLLSSALDDAQTQLGEFFDSKESAKSPEFSDQVERALIAYQSSFLIWKSKQEYKQDLVRSDHPTAQMMLQVYPEAASLFRRNGQADALDLVSFFWERADARILDAKRMVSGKSKR